MSNSVNHLHEVRTKYNRPGYESKNKYLGLVKIHACKPHLDLDDYWRKKLMLETQKPIPLRVMENAVAAMVYSRCQCSHDCCGHVSSTLYKIRRTGKRHYIAEVSYSRNV